MSSDDNPTTLFYAVEQNDPVSHTALVPALSKDSRRCFVVMILDFQRDPQILHHLQAVIDFSAAFDQVPDP
jgi:hypothetical protein